MNRIVILATGVALCIVLGACGGKDDPAAKGPDYTPISDSDLFAQIEGIPGVTKVDLSYRDEFGNSNNYVGEIEVGPEADGVAILDQSLAILRQGAPGASMTVVAVQDGKQISPKELGLNSTTDRRLTERYGPQPGDGKPPAPTP